MTERAATDAARAFDRVATNVAIITAPGPHGCTANVWAEAPEPPVLLITLRRGSGTHEHVTGTGRFAVNLLAEDQAALARRFAGPHGQRFADGSHTTGASGLPLLDGTLAALECDVRDVHWFGAYDIIVGEVSSARVCAERRPLIHFAGDLLATTPPERAP